MRFPVLLLLSLLFGQILTAQDTLLLSLEQAVDRARKKSVEALIAENQFNNAYWSFRSYKSDQLPELTLSGTVPSFDRTITSVTQPDGSELFVNRSLAQWNVDLAVSQEVIWTGGRVFVGSGLNRIDLFNDSLPTATSYSSSPFFIGYQQPIFRYNNWKWRRMIEPLRFEEAERGYVENMENVSLTAVNAFFDLFLAQLNTDIAETNRLNNDTIYKISEGRYNLGKIAENDLLQMELSLLNAQVAQAQAENDVANTTARLRRLLDLPEGTVFRLTIPSDIPELDIDPNVALEYARRYGSDPITFQRQELEAEESVAQARGNSGFSADLFAQFGLNNFGQTLGDAYRDPENFQNVGLSLDIPILDWGKARSQREIAIANRELVGSQIQQSLGQFEEEVLLLVQQFNLQGDQVGIAAKADTVSRKRFEVAKARYLIGKTDITDLNIASAEEDQARRAYLASLQTYWNYFYAVRRATLFDFVEGRVLIEE